MHRISTLAGALVTLAVAAGVLSVAAPAGADTAPNGRIAYSSSEDGDYDIYTMNADGTDVQNLTADSYADDVSPAWSPDGTKIAFATGRDGNQEIYVMNADGTEQTRLTETEEFDEDFSPAWSPDGSRISFTSTRGGDWDIYVMFADGTVETDITSPYQEIEYDDYVANWSPDGSKIVFTGVRDGGQEIIQVNPDGSGEVNLTNDDDPAWANINHFASYSPDGSKILWMRQPNNGGNDWDIWTMNPDGSGMENILPDDEWQDLYPSWSADGTQITFVSNRSLYGDDVFVMEYPPAPATGQMAEATAKAASGTTATVTQLTRNGSTNAADWQALRKPQVNLFGTMRGAAVVPVAG